MRLSTSHSAISSTMQRSRRRLTPLLLAACLIACALTRLPAPVTAAAEAETLSDEEIAEEATLAGEDDAIDAADIGEEQEEEAVDEKDVLVLTDATFDDAIKKHKYILVSVCICKLQLTYEAAQLQMQDGIV